MVFVSRVFVLAFGAKSRYMVEIMTLLAVPISGKDFDEAKQRIEAAIGCGAEILELRTDYLQNLCSDLVEKLIEEVRKASKKPLPIIVTCRDAKEGGVVDYSLDLRVEVLMNALKAGAEYIDFEYENFLNTESREKIDVALSENQKSRLILSAHNFESKFDNIEELYRQITTSAPAAIPKLVYKEIGRAHV